MSLKGRFVWGGAILLFLGFYFLFDPEKYSWMPQCLFHRFTGLDCIGCGSQRAVHALLHGDVSGAIEANALMVFSLPVLIFLLWLELSRGKYPALYARVHSLPVIVGIAGIMMCWLILRNL